MKIRTIEDVNKRLPQKSLLTAMSFAESVRYANGNPIRFANFICKCGVEKTYRLSYAIMGGVVSCGCKRRQDTIDRNTKYTKSIKKLNNVYHAMMARCYNPSHVGYISYGAKGVKVCDEWKGNYQAFMDWALANGWEEGLQLEKDIKGDGYIYSPESCCFVQQSINSMYQPKHSSWNKETNSFNKIAELI